MSTLLPEEPRKDLCTHLTNSKCSFYLKFRRQLLASYAHLHTHLFICLLLFV
nr:MAG TPA: hypothetical protein [Caudoviricetes sp.]